MSGFHTYELEESAAAARLGLIVLQQDETVESDFRRLMPDDVALFVSRIPSGTEINPESLSAMEGEIGRSAGLLPPAMPFDAIGYACTSASMHLGPGRVAELVKGGVTTEAVTNPFSAALAAFQALGVSRIGLVSPYVEAVSQALAAAFEAEGITIDRMVCFGEGEEAKVARIAGTSVYEAALAAASGQAEAVFLSCTNLRTLDVIGRIEADLGMPALSSNIALAWHMARLAGVTLHENAQGRLAGSAPAV